MLLWTFIISLCVAAVFLFVVFYGAPFLPTRRSRINEAIALLDLKPGQLLLELGSGDGRVLRAAAQKGIRSIGYELNPLLVVYSRLLGLRYRGLVKTKLANYWNLALPECDAIYVFLLNPYMARLDQKVSREITKPVKLLSFAFEIPGKKPVRHVDGLFLYKYLPRNPGRH